MLFKVKLVPNSRRTEVIKKTSGSFEVKVKAKAQKGRANAAALLALVGYFQTTPANVKLIRGFKQRNKIFEVKRNEAKK